MDKDYSENEKLEKEIADLQNKISEMKKGYQMTIHDFAIKNQHSQVYKKEKAALSKLYFNINKIITPPESSRYFI